MTCAPRLAYDDLAPIEDMCADARRAGAALGLASPLDRWSRLERDSAPKPAVRGPSATQVGGGFTGFRHAP